MKIAVSFIKSNKSYIETIKEIEKTDADFIHVDVMDGKFVKNKTFTLGELSKLLSKVTKPLDIHLMVSNPLKWIDDLATFNTIFITFHYEAISNPMEVINEIKSRGIKVGISIKPKTSINKIREFLPYIDQVLVMSVEPGKGGQAFKNDQILKINKLKEMQKDYSYLISVDGGINDENINLIDSDMVAVGSFITMNDNYQGQINKLRRN